MKYVLTITELEKLPGEWHLKDSWPSPGIYSVKGETCIYHVYEYGVDYIGFPSAFKKEEFVDQGESVSESLLLKAIAAASQAKVLTQ